MPLNLSQAQQLAFSQLAVSFSNSDPSLDNSVNKSTVFDKSSANLNTNAGSAAGSNGLSSKISSFLDVKRNSSLNLPISSNNSTLSVLSGMNNSFRISESGSTHKLFPRIESSTNLSMTKTLPSNPSGYSAVPNDSVTSNASSSKSTNQSLLKLGNPHTPYSLKPYDTETSSGISNSSPATASCLTSTSISISICTETGSPGFNSMLGVSSVFESGNVVYNNSLGSKSGHKVGAGVDSNVSRASRNDDNVMGLMSISSGSSSDINVDSTRNVY